MKRQRQLHLWIGIITSLFILIEAVTGLLLNERWILGVDGPGERMANEQSFDQAASQTRMTSQETEQRSLPNTGELYRKKGEGGSSLMGLIRGLHEGRVGDVNIKWVMDLTAIGLIILTITGIIMSLKILAAQKRSRDRQALTASKENYV